MKTIKPGMIIKGHICAAFAFFTRDPRKLYQPVVQGESADNGLVTLAALLELLNVQAAILILVHHTKDLPHPLLRRVLVFWKLHH